MRVFIAIDLPEEIKNELARLQEMLPEFLGSKTAKENLHLTLKFLGELDSAQIEQVRLKLREIKTKVIKARLSELGVFNENFVRIIWIHLSGAEHLQQQIDENLQELFPKEERFMSHITLARVKAIKERKSFLEIIKSIKPKWLEFPISSFSLKKSILAGKPVYEDIETYELE